MAKAELVQVKPAAAQMLGTHNLSEAKNLTGTHTDDNANIYDPYQ